MRETLQIKSFKDVITARCEVLAMLYILSDSTTRIYYNIEQFIVKKSY
jgi:hypothetical protein